MNISKVIQEDIKDIVANIANEAKALEGKTILITGGGGFIGKYFLYAFYYLNKNVFSEKCKVISVDNFITGNKVANQLMEEDSNFTFISKDVRERLNINESVDFVIHAAGIASPISYIKYPLETIEVATEGTKNLLEFAREKKVKSFLFFSSSEIYGDPDKEHVPTKETYLGNVSCIGPRACYDESKRLGETLCSVYGRLYDMPVKIVRPFNVFGPGLRADDYRVIPSFLTNALNGNSLPVHDKGVHTRAFCYISDAVSGFLKVLFSDKNKEAFNVGNSENEITMLGLAEVVVEIMGPATKIERVPYPPSYPKDDPSRRCPDLTKIESLLGYKAKVNLKSGLEKTVAWFREERKIK